MTTAFVLSGGGSLGSVQVGMMQALLEVGIEPDIFVGASAGALNAAFMGGRGFDAAALDDLAEIWVNLRRQQVFPIDPLHQTMALLGRRSSLCSNYGLRHVISKHLEYERFEDAVVPVHVVATDVLSGQDVLLSNGDPGPAVLASASIPAVLPAVELGGMTLFDGGVANNTPISHAVDLGADRVVVLPTGVACALDRPPGSTLSVAMHALTILIEQRLARDVQDFSSRVELILLPPLCPLAVSSIDFAHGAELISRAREASSRWLAHGGPKRDHPEQFLSLHSH